MNKKVIAVLIIIVIAIILLIFSGGNGNNQEVLPTRDTDGIETFGSAEEACAELTAAQEFDDVIRADEYYQTCLIQYEQ
jgi:L-asparagine transporter-like permease